jgi:hypothetical protein
MIMLMLMLMLMLMSEMDAFKIPRTEDTTGTKVAAEQGQARRSDLRTPRLSAVTTGAEEIRRWQSGALVLQIQKCRCELRARKIKERSGRG